MSAKSKGTARELAAKRWLAQQGWWTQRSAGSHGVCDLVCLRPFAALAAHLPFPVEVPPGVCEAMLVQVKANTGSPYMNFRAEERALLRAEALGAGATAALLHWAPRGQPMLLTSEFWPSSVVS